MTWHDYYKIKFHTNTTPKKKKIVIELPMFERKKIVFWNREYKPTDLKKIWYIAKALELALEELSQKQQKDVKKGFLEGLLG